MGMGRISGVMHFIFYTSCLVARNTYVYVKKYLSGTLQIKPHTFLWLDCGIKKRRYFYLKISLEI